MALKSVEPGYPLRGVIQLSQGAGQPVQEVKAIPESGNVWVDAPLLEALGLKLGDGLPLGDRAFTFPHIIVVEPDRGAGFMSFALGAVMINSADLPATRLVQPASRITYRLAVAGAGDVAQRRSEAAQRYLSWAQEQAKTEHGVRIESLESGRLDAADAGPCRKISESGGTAVCFIARVVAVALAARVCQQSS